MLREAVDAAQRLAGRLGRVPGVGRVQAVVAVAAGAAQLAEVRQQPHAPAVVRLGQRQQRLQLAALHLLELVAGRALVDHAALVHHIGQAVGHPGFGRLAVAAGAAGFLVVALDVLGQVEVGHEAHVGLVDAHAEGDGGHHHDGVLAQEAVLVLLPHRGVQARVVRQRGDAFVGQPHRGFFHLLAGAAVHDARFAFVLVAHEAHQLRARVVLLDDGVADVGPVEAGHEDARFVQRQPLHDVGAGDVVGGGGERHPRHLRKALVQLRQAQVLGPEIVAPLAHAVRFVDGEQAQQPALVERIQHRQKARRQQPLGRGIQHHQAAAAQLALHVLRFFAAERGIEEGRMHAGFFQRTHLVVHQGDQRAHHHRHAMAAAVPHDGRHLIAQALAAAGGHQHQRVAAGRHMLDDVALHAAERGVAEYLVENFDRRGGGGVRAVHGSPAS